jgi:hypothetical protein
MSKGGPPIFNVFQPGLRRGSENLPHDPTKSYAYVEHPTEGWRVYLRSCVFLYQIGETNPMNFLVVKRTGARLSSAAWEPPKGQMEGKDMRRHSQSPIMDLLAENVRRESFEEAHVTTITNLKHTGLAFQSQEADFPPNHFFQYHIFQGLLTPAQIKQSFDTFVWIKEHPKAFQRFKRDRKEKDAVAWYSPRHTRLNPRWCPGILALYLSSVRRV